MEFLSLNDRKKKGVVAGHIFVGLRSALTRRYRVDAMCWVARAIADEDAVEVVGYIASPPVSVASPRKYQAVEHLPGTTEIQEIGRYAPTFSKGKSNGKQVTEQPRRF